MLILARFARAFSQRSRSESARSDICLYGMERIDSASDFCKPLAPPTNRSILSREHRFVGNARRGIFSSSSSPYRTMFCISFSLFSCDFDRTSRRCPGGLKVFFRFLQANFYHPSCSRALFVFVLILAHLTAILNLADASRTSRDFYSAECCQRCTLRPSFPWFLVRIRGCFRSWSAVPLSGNAARACTRKVRNRTRERIAGDSGEGAARVGSCV